MNESSSVNRSIDNRLIRVGGLAEQTGPLSFAGMANANLAAWSSTTSTDWAAYYQNVADPASTRLLDEYNRRFPGAAMFTAGGACTGMYRGLWAAVVQEAGSLNQEAVIRALDHAKIAEGPGGPSEMVPGQHHVRMNMYIAQARGGHFQIVRNLGRVNRKRRLWPRWKQLLK